MTLSVFLPLGIEIGFTQERVNHSDCENHLHYAVIRKSRQSEQTFRFRLGTSTPRIPGLGEPATEFRDFFVLNSFVVMGPDVNEIKIYYLVFPDFIVERTEIFESLLAVYLIIQLLTVITALGFKIVVQYSKY